MLRLRLDHVGMGGPIVRFCQGEPSPAEVQEIVVKLDAAEQIEQAPKGSTPLSIHDAFANKAKETNESLRSVGATA